VTHNINSLCVCNSTTSRSTLVVKVSTARRVAAVVSLGSLWLMSANEVRAEAGAPNIACGGSHTCYRKSNGSLWCWGSDVYGQLGDGTFADKILPLQVASLGGSTVEVTAGEDFTCGRRSDSTLQCWGVQRRW
jgi:hypothetical protein